MIWVGHLRQFKQESFFIFIRKKGALASPLPLTLRCFAGLSFISAPLSSRTQSINTLNILSSRITVFGFTFSNRSSRQTAKCFIFRSFRGISPSQRSAVTLRGYFSLSALLCRRRGTIHILKDSLPHGNWDIRKNVFCPIFNRICP